jgi:hypothetical protein
MVDGWGGCLVTAPLGGFASKIGKVITGVEAGERLKGGAIETANLADF